MIERALHAEEWDAEKAVEEIFLVYGKVNASQLSSRLWKHTLVVFVP